MINLSSASLNTPETDVSRSISQLSEQRQQTIAQFDYNLPVTDREYESIGRAIQQNPDEEPYRFASAIRFSREFGISVENSMMRLDELTEYQTGKKFSPTKSTWKAIVDSFEMGKLQIPKADLEKQYKYLDLAGEDTSQIEQQIAEYERMFEELGDSTPRNLLTQALKAGAQTLPYTAQIALGGASKGLVAGLGAAGLAAIAGVATVGALPVSIAASIIAVATAAGGAFSFKEAYDLMEGGEYYRMRKNGVPKDIALPISNMSAWVQAGVETFLGLVPAGIGNITGAQTLTSRALAKLAISGKWGTAGKFLGTWVGQSFEEGAEEAVQALTGWTADIVAAELSDVMPPERSVPILTEALEGAKQGFLASLVLGAGGSVMSSVSDTSLLGQIRRDAQSTPSKETFIDKHRDNAPEGIAESEWTTALSDVYEQNKPKRTERQAEMELDSTPGEATPVARLKSGRIYAQESEQVNIAPDGSESRILKVGDPISSKRYGFIGYTRTDNSIEIDEVRFDSAYNNVRKESILELGRQNPGVDISWNPQTENLLAIRDEIIAEQGTLNPYATEQANMEPRLALQEKIKQAMPALDAPQRTAAATLIELRAEAKGMTLESYMDTYFDQRVFAEEGLQGDQRGGITFEQTEDGVKALIYAGQNADFSTFSHEAFHLFRREMAQTPQLQSALTSASQDASFTAFIEENKNFLKMDTAQATSVLATFGESWTRDQEELTAKLWELYLKEGKAPTTRMEALFDKLKAWFGRIYGRLAQTTQLDSRIREVFDSLLDKDSELAQQVRGQGQQVQEGMVAQEQLFQEAPPTDSPAFKAWFGDSKVVDENGEPLVVYHGTNSSFQEFLHSKIGSHGTAFGKGFYFTADYNTAKGYSNTGNVIEVYLNIRNPLSKDSKGFSKKELSLIINKLIDLEMQEYGDDIESYKDTFISNYVDTYSMSRTSAVKEIAQIIYEQEEGAIDNISELANSSGDKGLLVSKAVKEILGYDGYVEENFQDTGKPAYVAWESNQIKSVNNQGTFDPDNPNILFQDENTVLSEAAQFSSWEDFRDGYTAFLEAMYDEVPDYDDDWFINTWERANPTGNDQAADQRFLQDINGEGLLPFLKEIGRIIQERLEQPGDQEEAEYTDRLQNVKARIQQEVSPFMRNTALQSLKTTPNAQSMKAIRTTIANAPRFYRDVYAEVMNKPDMKPMVMDEFLPSIDEPLFSSIETASITERVNLSKRIEAAELKKKILSGKEKFDGDAEKVIRQMDSEIKAEQERIAKLEADLLKTGTRLSDSERKAVDLSTQIEDTRRELDKAQKNIQKRIGKNQSVPQSMMTERANLSEKVKNLMAEFNLLSKSNRTKAALDKQQAIKKAKDAIRAKQKERADAVRVRKYKERLAAKIMAPVSKATDYKYKLPIMAIQATIDPKFRTGNVKYNGKTVALKDIQAIVDELGEYDITQTLPKRIADRLNKTPLNELELTDLEDIASRVATLRKTGRLVQQARTIFNSELANSYAQTISNSLIDTGKYTPPSATGSVEDIQAKRSIRERFRSMFYDTLDMPRKAIMLDHDKKGTAYDLLVDRQRDAYRVKESNIARRMATIEQVMKDAGVTYEDAYKQVEVDGTTFTISDLAMVYLGAKNEQSRMAIAYGNLMDARERDSMTNEEVRSVGNERLERVLEAAQANLDEKMLKVLDAISNDFNTEFDRMNEVAIREFNTPISRVDNYVPIRRQEMTGDDLANAVADDWMNMNAGGAKVGIQKGMTITRVNISPKNQKPMKLDLFGTHAEAINMQEHFIAFAEYGRELNRVFKGNQALRETIRGTFGDSMLSDVDDYINEVINPKAFQRMKNVDKAIRALRGNLYAAYLTYKTSGVVLQFITSPMPFLAEVNPLKLADAYLEVTTKPRETMAMINELSIVMRNRVMDPAWKLVKDESAKYSRPMQKKFKRFQEIGGMGMEIADKWSVAGGWLAVFKNEVGKAELVDDAVIQKAVRKADDAVLRTQPSSRPEDLAPLFKQGGEALKAFTQFQTALNVIWKNVVFDVPLFIRQGEYAKAIGQSVGYVLAGALLGAVMEGYDEDDDEAQKAKKWVYWGFTQFTDSVPLIGSLVNNVAESVITGEKPYMFPSTFYPSASEITKGVINLSQGEWEKAVKDLSEGFGYATGLPVSGAKQIFRAFDEGPEAVLGRIE